MVANRPPNFASVSACRAKAILSVELAGIAALGVDTCAATPRESA